MGYFACCSCLSWKPLQDKNGQELLAGMGRGMGCTEWGGDQFSCNNLPRGIVDVHRSTTTQDIVDLLGTLMGVPANRGTRRDHHVLDTVQVASQVHAIDQLFPKTHVF